MEAIVTRPNPPSDRQLSVLQATVDRAMARSADTLSEMSGVPITMNSSAIQLVPLAQVPLSAGRPDEPAVGVYVGMEGDGNGYVLLLLEESMALELAALMLGEDASAMSLEDELCASALAEAGNVACSSFMNEVGAATGLRLMAMPPVAIGDMRAAIMDVAIADIAQTGDEALLITTQLAPQGSEAASDASRVTARLLAIPTPETLATMLERLQAPGSAGGE